MLRNMAMDFDLGWQNFRKGHFIFRFNSLCESAVSQFNLLIDVTLRVVTMHTLVYSNHVAIDKNNDIMSPTVNMAAP